MALAVSIFQKVLLKCFKLRKYIIWRNNYDWKYLTKFQKFVVLWSQVTKLFSSHSLFLLKLRNLTKYLRFFPRLSFFVQSQKLTEQNKKNCQTESFFFNQFKLTAALSFQLPNSQLFKLQIGGAVIITMYFLARPLVPKAQNLRYVLIESTGLYKHSYLVFFFWPTFHKRAQDILKSYEHYIAESFLLCL